MATSISAIAPALFVPYASPQSAQVHLLSQRGESPAEIAAILSLPLATVYSVLGITVQGSPANAVPIQTPAPAQSGAAQTRLSIFG
jgi:hypothetical protein